MGLLMENKGILSNYFLGNKGIPDCWDEGNSHVLSSTISKTSARISSGFQTRENI